MAYDEPYPAQAPLDGAGPRLKAAREAAGLSVDQISAQTKIPARMLALIEAGEFAALPARTYATGFTRTYARALGLDEAEYVAAVLKDLGTTHPAEQRHVPAFEPGDPARVPTAKFAWLAALMGLVVIAAGLFFWRTYYAPAVSLPSILAPGIETSAPANGGSPLATAVPTAGPAAAANEPGPTAGVTAAQPARSSGVPAPQGIPAAASPSVSGPSASRAPERSAAQTATSTTQN